MIDRVRSAAMLAALALGAAACGGGDDSRKLTTPGAAELRRPPEPTPLDVDPAKVRVVREWADTLRRGDVRGAARFFALPSTVANGTVPLRIETRAHARFFNRTLPCGAKLIATEPAEEGSFIATFRLTERPGRGRCGSGTGATARTAFQVRGGLITAWVRVPDEDPDDDAQA
jgi:hypothetical protein